MGLNSRGGQDGTAVTETTSAPHWSLEPYTDYLNQVSSPRSAFDAAGTWEHTYDVFPVYGKLDVTGPAWSKRHKGTLRLNREPASEGGAHLRVFSEVTFLDFGKLPTKHQRTMATMRCLADVLATPVEWRLESAAVGRHDPSPMPFSEFEESGKLRGEAVELSSGGRLRSFDVGDAVTSNWSLFEAVQRLPREGSTELRFTMLEDLRLLRLQQRLVSESPVEVQFANGPETLYGFRQTGEGVLPIHYWLDEHGRLLLAIGNVRAYILRGGQG